MEGLGTSFIESIMVLVQFIPILFGLSVGIPIFFFWRLAIRIDYRRNCLVNRWDFVLSCFRLVSQTGRS